MINRIRCFQASDCEISTATAARPPCGTYTSHIPWPCSDPNLDLSFRFFHNVSSIQEKDSGPGSIISRPVRGENTTMVVLWRFSNQNLTFHVFISRRQSDASKARTQRESENKPNFDPVLLTSPIIRLFSISRASPAVLPGRVEVTWRRS
jgi:hypothetical protein